MPLSTAPTRTLLFFAGKRSSSILFGVRSYPYPIQYWRIGAQRLFTLGGELVSDYALRLKASYGADIFVMGYANDVMSYIPSTLIWDEGGYEGALAHRVYALPARWTRDVQTRILDAVQDLIPNEP